MCDTRNDIFRFFLFTAVFSISHRNSDICIYPVLLKTYNNFIEHLQLTNINANHTSGLNKQVGVDAVNNEQIPEHKIELSLLSVGSRRS